MNNLPTQLENETGLHQRYYIQKIVRQPVEFMGEPCEDQLVLKEVDLAAEYFVMRLDAGGKDPKHIEACRIGVNAYADAIKDHLPELAADLKERYPIQSPAQPQDNTPLIRSMQAIIIEQQKKIDKYEVIMACK